MLRPGPAGRLARRRWPRSSGRNRCALALLAASTLAPAGTGAAGLSTFRAQMWDQDLLQVPDDAEPGDHLGDALASGDFDGDGYGDLAIGLPREGIPGGAGEIGAAGTVIVLHGSTTGLDLPRAQFWHQDSPGVLDLAEVLDVFGTALAAGDFNGDGYDDLAIGAPGEDFGFGSVNVLYGSESGLSATGDQLWSQGAPGVSGDPTEWEEFGKSLAAADFDDDGYADLAIGVPQDNWAFESCDSGCGGVNVLFGSSVGLTADNDQYYPADDFSGVYDSSDGFGRALAAADFDGDGFADLAIGAPWDDFLGVGNVGSVRVLFGSGGGLTTAGDLYLLGPEEEARQGSALAAGDLDGDGFADLAIGIPGRTVGGDGGAGAVLIRLGGGGGLGDGGEWSQESAGVQGGAEPDDHFGAALACGDFDGDGRADLAIGAPGEDLSEADEGAVHVLFGAESGVTASGDQLWYRDLLPPADFSPTNLEDSFGAALATGDFDGNGHADLAIGAPGEALTTTGNAGAVFTLHGSLFADDFELGDDSRWSTSAP